MEKTLKLSRHQQGCRNASRPWRACVADEVIAATRVRSLGRVQEVKTAQMSVYCAVVDNDTAVTSIGTLASDSRRLHTAS